MCHSTSAEENLYDKARSLQRAGQFEQAVDTYRDYLTQPIDEENLKDQELSIYTDALIQLMNSYQNMGEPQMCVEVLKDVFDESPALQTFCLRDYYSVLGYALSRTEKMSEAETITLKALTLPLYEATPERYFRDYAYAAAVFYSNPDYHNEVINWCQEALHQAQLSKNSSGQQWVTAMLGSIYKRSGKLNEALELFQQSKKDAESRKDALGILNSLHTLTDLFIYWNIPEYANIYATEAIKVEKGMTTKNPMVSAQSYINKARTLDQLGERDSISIYIEQARKLCEHLPYNSGMVDVNLLNGIYLTDRGGDSLESGIKELEQVTTLGTLANRVRAYHQLAQTYLKNKENQKAENMLDSLYVLLNNSYSPNLIHVDYKPILDYYLKKNNKEKVSQYIELMQSEQQAFREQKLNYNLVEAIVDLQTGSSLQELKIIQLKEANQRLWLLIYVIISVIILTIIVAALIYQRKRHKIQIRQAETKVANLIQKLKQSNDEKEKISQEINEFLQKKENLQELETITPYILKESGEVKFRQCFEIMYPLFLHRLREKVPSVTRREELLSMLIALKQDNREIAELLSIEPRSVLMLRHRFRQKIGMTTEYSLENFIHDLLDMRN
jgi:tetratricopeptide (TPR) repeat protein/DNA-binding CsgD family transcriptional regulator